VSQAIVIECHRVAPGPAPKAEISAPVGAPRVNVEPGAPVGGSQPVERASYPVSPSQQGIVKPGAAIQQPVNQVPVQPGQTPPLQPGQALRMQPRQKSAALQAAPMRPGKAASPKGPLVKPRPQTSGIRPKRRSQRRRRGSPK
jgi:hypothetical protein